MSAINDGGPAFPGREITYDGGQDRIEVPHGGMTLRDWFAGQALVGMGTWAPEDPDLPATESIDLRRKAELTRRARWAYAQADAMLAARAEGR